MVEISHSAIIYVLYMSHLLESTKDILPVATCSDYQRLVDWYNSLRCKKYRDGKKYKSFKKGSPLEDFRPLDSIELNSNHGCPEGIYEKLLEPGRPYRAWLGPYQRYTVWLG